LRRGSDEAALEGRCVSEEPVALGQTLRLQRFSLLPRQGPEINLGCATRTCPPPEPARYCVPMMAKPLRTIFRSSSSTGAPAFRLSASADSSAFSAATQVAA
jgi:hypothetical protein